MKRIVLLVVAMVLLVGFWAISGLQAKSQGQNAKVEKIVFCTGVESRDPIGEGDTFNASADRIYCWIKIVADNVPIEVKHIWYADNKKVAEIPLSVKYSSTRTWSNKSIWVAQWKVEVIDDTGEILATKTFTVK